MTLLCLGDKTPEEQLTNVNALALIKVSRRLDV